MKRLLAVCVVLLMIGACDEIDRDPPVEVLEGPEAIPSEGPSGDTSPSAPISSALESQPGLPPEVAEVRTGIVNAADGSDYEMLRPLMKPEVFLSDYGFGVDPIARWEELGDEPLALMRALLSMGYAEEGTNEGHVYRWPTYDSETKALEDISPQDRRSFLSVMSREEFRRIIPNDEFGYVGPRLGILANGTWWFFILEPGP